MFLSCLGFRVFTPSTTRQCSYAGVKRCMAARTPSNHACHTSMFKGRNPLFHVHGTCSTSELTCGLVGRWLPPSIRRRLLANCASGSSWSHELSVSTPAQLNLRGYGKKYNAPLEQALQNIQQTIKKATQSGRRRGSIQRYMCRAWACRPVLPWVLPHIVSCLFCARKCTV